MGFLLHGFMSFFTTKSLGYLVDGTGGRGGWPICVFISRPFYG